MNFDQIIHFFLQWISSQNEFVIWLFFAFSNFLENVFPPWPGDTVTVFGGFMVARNTFNIYGLVTSTFIGNIVGGLLMYKFGHRFLHWLDQHTFPFKTTFYTKESIHQTFTWFHRNAPMVVLISRFSAGIRFFVSIVAGMARMNLFYFLLYFSTAIILWCGLLIYGGFYLGKNWEEVVGMIQIYNKIILIILLSIFGFVVYRKYGKGKKERKN